VTAPKQEGGKVYARVFSMRTPPGISHAVNPANGKTFCGLDATGWAVDNGIYSDQSDSAFDMKDGCHKCIRAIKTRSLVAETLAVMLAHCPEHSCDGCPGVEYHCPGRIGMNYVAAKRLSALRTAGDALREYASHYCTCALLGSATRLPCDCGLATALAAWRKASKP
jgi:hypothetical protein